MDCPNCRANLPEDALFCIECGAPVRDVSTGPTLRLPDQPASQSCPDCGRTNPAIARYCMTCGRMLDAAQPRLAAAADAGSAGNVAPTFGWRDLLPWLMPVTLLLLALALFRVWPGFLIFIGVGGFVGGMSRRYWLPSLLLLAWSFGLSFLLAVPRLLIPGILALILISTLIIFASRLRV